MNYSCFLDKYVCPSQSILFTILFYIPDGQRYFLCLFKSKLANLIPVLMYFLVRKLYTPYLFIYLMPGIIYITVSHIYLVHSCDGTNLLPGIQILSFYYYLLHKKHLICTVYLVLKVRPIAIIQRL